MTGAPEAQQATSALRVSVVAEQLRREVPGGIGTYIQGLAQGLRSLGPDAPAYQLWASRLARRATDPLDILGPSKLSPLPPWALLRAWGLGMAGPGDQVDVVHATSFAVPPRGRTPLSVMVHDLAWRRHPEAYPARGARWHEKALHRALRRADRFVVPSELTAQDLVAAGADAGRVRVVPEGCDHLPPADHAAASALLEGRGIKGGYLLTVSTLEPRKNLHRLIEAYRRVRPSLPEPWPLVVVGPVGWDGTGSPEPITRISGEDVIFAGPAPSAALNALYERARLVAYVPLWEGFGLPPVEAMRAGTPVVSSAVPSTEDAAFEVEANDTDSISNGLLEVATDDALRQDLVVAGRRRASQLTWQRAAREHVEIWASIQ